MLSCFKKQNNNNSINDDNICSICLANIDKSTQKLPCNHEFHKNCIDVWLKNNASCPICRTNIIIDIPKLPINKIDVINNNSNIRIKYYNINKKRASFIFLILTIMFFVGSCCYNDYQFNRINNNVNNYIKYLNETQLGNYSNTTYDADVLIGVDLGYYLLFIICIINLYKVCDKGCCSTVCAFIWLGILLISNLIIRFEYFRITNKFLQEKDFNFDSSYYDDLSLSLIFYGCSYGCKIFGMILYAYYKN